DRIGARARPVVAEARPLDGNPETDPRVPDVPLRRLAGVGAGAPTWRGRGGAGAGRDGAAGGGVLVARACGSRARAGTRVHADTCAGRPGIALRGCARDSADARGRIGR